MQVVLAPESPDLPRHKCLVLGIFSDERPPRGICGFIDWRINGFISREIKAGRIKGEFREKVIIPFPGRIGTEILFLFGLGRLAEINYEKIYTSSYEIAEAVAGMKINDFAFDLQGENRSNLALAAVVESMITGYFDYFSRDVEKLADMTVRMVSSITNLKQISIGIQRFKSNVKDMGTVDATALGSDFA
ncbi:MAG: M17 family peptidase N-terminal domain-containing protein [Smithella sp.]